MRNLLAIALMLLAGCSNAGRPFLQCTVDDTLSFTVADVRFVRVDGTILRIARKGNRATVHRNMLPGETCERVAAIQWELAP